MMANAIDGTVFNPMTTNRSSRTCWDGECCCWEGIGVGGLNPKTLGKKRCLFFKDFVEVEGGGCFLLNADVSVDLHEKIPGIYDELNWVPGCVSK